MKQILNPTHKYVLDTCRSMASTSHSILDYGCGSGILVEALHNAGYQVNGVDVFYAGSRAGSVVRANGLLGVRVFEMTTDSIPFSDKSCDLVISNQVFEHVENLDIVLREIHRVLGAGGRALVLFPTRDVWREGHCGVAFAHWFRKDSALLTLWLFAFRCLGFGYFTEGKSRYQWASDFNRWLSLYTHYRSKQEVFASIASAGFEYEPMEFDYMMYRLRHSRLRWLSRLASAKLLQPLICVACHKLAGRVLVLTRRPD